MKVETKRLDWLEPAMPRKTNFHATALPGRHRSHWFESKIDVMGWVVFRHSCLPVFAWQMVVVRILDPFCKYLHLTVEQLFMLQFRPFSTKIGKGYWERNGENVQFTSSLSYLPLKGTGFYLQTIGKTSFFINIIGIPGEQNSRFSPRFFPLRNSAYRRTSSKIRFLIKNTTRHYAEKY